MTPRRAMAGGDEARMRIYGGVGRTQATGVYSIYVGSEHGLSSVYGTLEELRMVIESMTQELERYETAASDPAGSGEAAE